MEKLDHSSLQPLIKHPEIGTPAACVAGGRSTIELSRQLAHLTVLIRYRVRTGLGFVARQKPASFMIIYINFSTIIIRTMHMQFMHVGHKYSMMILY
jgi:hypothetical protein